MNALELRAALALAAVYMFRMLGLFMVLPVIAVSATQYTDYTPFLVGLAVGGYGLMQAILQMPMGALSDKWGRKPVILIGLFIFAVGSIVAAQAESMSTLIIGRFLQGGGAVASAIMALATDVSREKSRPYIMATIGIAIGFSFYIAVLVGPPITAAYGLAGVFWLTAATAVASMPMILLLVPNSIKSIASQELVPRKTGVKRLITASQLWRLNVNVFLLHLCITLLFVPLPKLLNIIGYPLAQHWQIYLPVLLTAIVGLGILMSVARRRKDNIATMSACVLIALGLLSLVLLPLNLNTILIAAILFFSGFNFLEATFPSMVASLAPAGEKGSAMGLYASCQFLGAFTGGVVAGGILSFSSAQTVLMAGVVIGLCMLIVSRNLHPIPKTSRIALPLDGSHGVAVKQIAALQQLEGVIEASRSGTSNVVHLKINERFDPVAANQVLESA